nr:26S proteasome regulatory subunit S10B homolog B-like [Tanacetum cinerariifolium]
MYRKNDYGNQQTPDVLDPTLLRSGRLDRKIEIPLPNEQSRMEILKVHAAGIAKHGENDYEAVVTLAETKSFTFKANVLHGSSRCHSRGCSSSADNTIHEVQKQVVTVRFNKSLEAIWTTCSEVSETIYSF